VSSAFVYMRLHVRRLTPYSRNNDLRRECCLVVVCHLRMPIDDKALKGQCYR
jgi:hypothetical protein